MKKICKLLGTFCLAISVLISISGPASFSGVGVEEMPESIKNKR
jgi:hypothetical protein